MYLISIKKNTNKLDRGLPPRPVVGVSLLRADRAVDESDQGAEGAVVWLSLPAREHDFLAKGFRPARVPLAARASPVAAGLGRGVERRQGGELGQLALVESISVLGEETEGKTR